MCILCQHQSRSRCWVKLKYFKSWRPTCASPPLTLTKYILFSSSPMIYIFGNQGIWILQMNELILLYSWFIFLPWRTPEYFVIKDVLIHLISINLWQIQMYWIWQKCFHLASCSFHSLNQAPALDIFLS